MHHILSIPSQHLYLFWFSNVSFFSFDWNHLLKKWYYHAVRAVIDIKFWLWLPPVSRDRAEFRGHKRGAGDLPALREQVQLCWVDLWLNSTGPCVMSSRLILRLTGLPSRWIYFLNQNRLRVACWASAEPLEIHTGGDSVCAWSQFFCSCNTAAPERGANLWTCQGPACENRKSKRGCVALITQSNTGRTTSHRSPITSSADIWFNPK